MPLPLVRLVAVCLVAAGCTSTASTTGPAQGQVGDAGTERATAATADAATSPAGSAADDGTSTGTPDGIAASEGFAASSVALTDGTRRIDVPVLVADEPDLRRTGLSNRDDLPDDAGMLFVFEEPQRVSFWMKDTRIPLSIAFARADGTITGITDMDPCRRTPCPRFPSDGEVLFALEVNQGWFARNGVTLGWTLDVDAEGR